MSRALGMRAWRFLTWRPSCAETRCFFSLDWRVNGSSVPICSHDLASMMGMSFGSSTRLYPWRPLRNGGCEWVFAVVESCKSDVKVKDVGCARGGSLPRARASIPAAPRRRPSCCACAS